MRAGIQSPDVLCMYGIRQMSDTVYMWWQTNWDNARVIDTCHHYYTRIFLESWYISSKRHAMNKDRGPLSSVYRTLHMQLD